jgi:CelD/BcsL family acetyltransferase involved in cellulose biosynthesis
VSLAARAWRGRAAFAELAPDWERLAAAAGLDPLCNAHAWTRAYAAAYAADRDVLGWRFEDSGATVGIVALRREPSRGALALRRALFLADGTFDSDYLEPPVAPGHERAVAGALVDAARAERGIEALVLAGMPAESRFLAALRAELAARGLARREHPVVCLSAPLPDGAGSFDAYLATLKPRMRTKVRSAMRTAEEQGARIEWLADAAALEPWLAELYRLHELRWQAEGRTGSFADPRRRAFFAALAGDALAAGTLRFARLVQEGRVLATQFGVVAGPRYYQIQEGYDPAHESARVGVALRGLAVAALVAAGVRAYDFMAGDARHKRDWGGLERPCTTIAFPLPKWRARLAYGLRERVESWRA